MVYGAIDLHMRYSQIRIVDAEGRVVREQRVLTSAERLVAVFGGHGPMRILLETGTESEWVAQALEAAGHEVIVADPNYAPMYGEIRRKVKTDRRDVAALAEANRRGWYRATHRVSGGQRALRQVLRSRRQLVQMRSGTIALMRSLLRQEGYRLPAEQSVSGCRRASGGAGASRATAGDARALDADGRDADDGDRWRGCAIGDVGPGGSDRPAAAERARRRAGGRADVPSVCR